MSQVAIPFHFMRGGTSRGPYLNRADLPEDLETLADDLRKFLGGELGMRGEDIALFPHTHDQSGDRGADVSELFGQLSKQEVLSLYEVYRLDHEMFGYGIEPYLSMAKDDSVL